MAYRTTSWHEDVKRKREYYQIIIFLKGLGILHQERRGQVKAIVMDHFNGIFFHKSGSANRQHTNHSISQTVSLLDFMIQRGV